MATHFLWNDSTMNCATLQRSVTATSTIFPCYSFPGRWQIVDLCDGRVCSVLICRLGMGRAMDYRLSFSNHGHQILASWCVGTPCVNV